MSLATEIRARRKKLNLTQTDLAREAGYSHVTISALEREPDENEAKPYMPGGDVLSRTAKVLGCTIDDLTKSDWRFHPELKPGKEKLYRGFTKEELLKGVKASAATGILTLDDYLDVLAQLREEGLF